MGHHKKHVPEPITWGYRRHEGFNDSGPMRLWASNWGGDMFEVVSQADFQTWKRLCEILRIPLRNLDAEDAAADAAYLEAKEGRR